ncbi:MAG: hypothetical protein IKZ48_04515 [Prevotella sp.]|nr:hypothetical protein [Prevotella sp.]
MKVKFGLIALLAAVLFVGCKGDDDESSSGKGSKVQVMTVFAPSQLGDMGYADRVMKGISILKDTDKDDVEVSIITSDKVETTRQMLKDWVAKKASVMDGAVYSRRLLVLTEPYMVEWLAEAKDQLQPTDEVLLLKVNEDDVKAAAQTLGMADRVHGLNISLASSVKRFDDMRRQYYQWTNQDPDSIPLYLTRLYDKKVMNYRDSIPEMLTTLQSEPLDSVTLPIIDKAGEQYSNEYKVTAFEAAYHVCGYCYGLAYMRSEQHQDQGKTKVFVICDMGAANNGAEMFLMTTNQYVLVVMLMVDSETNTDLIRFSVTRHFDRAVANWAQQWINKTTMPLMEQHGAWDGYCTDDIDPELLRGI